MIVKVQRGLRFEGIVPDDMFDGHFRQAVDEFVGEEEYRLVYCICGEFFDEGRAGRQAARDHLIEHQGETAEGTPEVRENE